MKIATKHTNHSSHAYIPIPEPAAGARLIWPCVAAVTGCWSAPKLRRRASRARHLMAGPRFPLPPTRPRLTSAISNRSSWAIVPAATTSSPGSFTTGWIIGPPMPIVGKSEGGSGTVGKARITRKPCRWPTARNHLALTDQERLTIREVGGRWRSAGRATAARRRQIEGRAHRTGPAAVHVHLRGLSSAHRSGLPNVFPPLAGSDFLNADKNRAIQT
jgi:hypothetical protein